MTPKLRPYQIDLLERIRAQMGKGVKRILAQASTGAGKTHISSEIVRCAALKDKRVLFLAHRRRLIDQKSERLDWFGVHHGVIMSGKGRTNSLVQVASRDTLLSRAVRGSRMDLPPADLVIVDETRTCMSDEYQELLAAYPNAHFIGLDATPARSDGRGLGGFYQAMECAVPTSQLVREGYLVPVKCFAPERIIDGAKVKGLAGDPVAHWQRLAFGRPTVLFAAKVSASLAARDLFLAAGIPAEHIDAQTPDDERKDIIARVRRGETKVVCNVGIWTEGVDIEELSCCQLLRCAGSLVLFLQAVGRVMRSHPGKTDAILIDHAGAVMKHGFPDEDFEWSLDTEDTVDARRKAKKPPKPITCPKCSFIFTSAIRCPACGYMLNRKQAKAALEELSQTDILTEVDRGQNSESMTREEQIRYWKKCLAIAANKGQVMGMASGMFRSKYKIYPPNDFPNMVYGSDWKRPVAELFPNFVRSKVQV